jgi:hypothetical protein
VGQPSQRRTGIPPLQGGMYPPPPQLETKGHTEWVATPLLAAASSKRSTALQAPLALKDPLFCEPKTSTVTPAP